MGTTAATILVLKERQLVEQFRALGALTSGTSQTLAALRIADSRPFQRLCERGVVREASRDMYYLDESQWDALRRSRRMAALVALIVLTGAVVAMQRFAR